MRGIRARSACLTLAVGLAAALAACSGGGAGGPVTVLVPWAPGTAEYTAFQTVAGQFTDKTGIQVNPKSTRALTQQLSADLAAKDPPDIADLPNPSAVDEYQGHGLVPAAGISLSAYDEPWRSLAEATSAGTVLRSGRLLAVPVKADIKSLLWYNSATLRSPPRSWAELASLSAHGTPWCLGLASGPTSGWPGADWIADIILATTPVTDYKDWLNGTLSWTTAPVRTAWQEWGTLLGDGPGKEDSAVAGGPSGALSDPFSSTIGRSCQLEHGALSAISPRNITGYDYVPFPSESGKASPVLVSGDFMALFTSNPNATQFLKYLASPEAQQLWVRQPGYAFSADSAVTPAMYPPGVRQKLAALLVPGAHAATLCYTAADVMTPDVSAAFYQVVLNYVNNPGSLTSSLTGLQETQQAKPTPLIWQDACHTP